MEALVAISLASNITQFLDFGIRSLKTVRLIYRSANGSLKLFQGMEQEAVEHIRCFQRMRDDELRMTDPELYNRVIESQLLAEEIISLIRSFGIEPGKNRLVETATKSVKALNATARIKEMQRRLDNIRQWICIRLDILLK